MNHPAHFHLFRNTIASLSKGGNKIIVAVKNKDVLLSLIKEIDNKVLVINRRDTPKRRGVIANLLWLIQNNIAIYAICQKCHPDILVGCNYATSQIGRLLSIPSLTFAEDDWFITKEIARIGYTFTSTLLSPISCNMDPFKHKTIYYHGFHKLAYLHPDVFNSKRKKLKIDMKETQYFLIRLSAFNAYHDHNVKGLHPLLLKKVIDILKPHGKIFLSLEDGLNIGFEEYRLQIDPNDMHHFLANAALFIGDSQSMAVESAMLGVPNIRFNDFVGKIGVLNEIENKWSLSTGIHSSKEMLLLETIKDHVDNNYYLNEYQVRRKAMLNEKINVSKFMTWFIINYPRSVSILHNNPDYQVRFI